MRQIADPQKGATGVAVTVAVVAAVLAVAAALATVTLVAKGSRANAQTARLARTGDGLRAEALAAGRQIAVDFAAYDYRQIAQDFNRVAAESTGAFHREYLTQSAGVKDLIQKAQSVSTAEVAGAAVVDASSKQATVVIALNRVVKNTSVPAGQRDSFGLQMTLVHQGNRWLASQVKPL